MAKGKTKNGKPLSPKKEFRNQISTQLMNALTGLEEKLEKKELESRVKKAAKLLTAGIKIRPEKPAKAKPAKKEEIAVEPKKE